MQRNWSRRESNVSDDVKGDDEGEVGVKEDKEEVEEDDDTVEEEKEGCGETDKNEFLA